MKKIFLMLVILNIFSSNCLAMTFSQPVKIGTIGYSGGGPKIGGVEIKGASEIKDFSTNKKIVITQRV